MSDMHLLFVCSKNKWRSPTAENLFRGVSGTAVRSAGVSASAKHHLSQDDVRWATHIFSWNKSIWSKLANSSVKI